MGRETTALDSGYLRDPSAPQSEDATKKDESGIMGNAPDRRSSDKNFG